MELKDILESNNSKTIQTETGTATLNADGSMVLDNSGCIQKLTPSQVKVAWSGKDKPIPYTKEQLEHIADRDGDEVAADAAKYGLASWDGEYWNFGEEQHETPEFPCCQHDIPSRSEFE